MQLWTPMWIAVRRRSGCGTHSDWGRTGRAIPVWPYQLSSASSSLVRITSQPSQHREIDLRPRLNNRPAFRCAQQTKPQHVTSERTRPSPPSRSTRTVATAMWGIHLGLFLLLIDVDRTGSDWPFPTLCSGKHKYGFHACGADPPHLRLRPVLSPRCFLILIAKRRD